VSCAQGSRHQGRSEGPHHPGQKDTWQVRIAVRRIRLRCGRPAHIPSPAHSGSLQRPAYCMSSHRYRERQVNRHTHAVPTPPINPGTPPPRGPAAASPSELGFAGCGGGCSARSTAPGCSGWCRRCSTRGWGCSPAAR
jgi:hypothetical protein